VEQLLDSDPIKEDMHAILDAANRSADLTRQLLAFSRKQRLNPTIVDLNVLLRKLENMLKRVVSEDIVLCLDTTDDCLPVLVDKGNMEQIIMNLAINARDAMNKSGHLSLTTCVIDIDAPLLRNSETIRPGSYALLSVTDTGFGMDESTLSHIFDPFFTTKKLGEGTGLGLSTAYGIIKQSGGYIVVTSEPNEGTTFQIFLPLSNDQVEASVTLEKSSKIFGKEHILIVEDEESLRLLFESMLTKLGFKITLAVNATEALYLLEEANLQPDLIITDIVMPGMSGVELKKLVKEKNKKAKILLMTGYADDKLLSHGIHPTDSHLIMKPFTFKEITTKIASMLH
jgi:CheY-like chemotaxis protein